MASSKNNWHDAGQNCLSYLLRCWQEEELPDREEPGAVVVWRFTLVPLNEKSSTKGFASIEELCASLNEELKADTSNYLSARKGGNI